MEGMWELTLLATGQLRTLTTNLGIEALREGLDEIEDVCVSTSLFNLLLCDFRLRLDRTQKDVEANRAGIQCLKITIEQCDDILSR